MIDRHGGKGRGNPLRRREFGHTFTRSASGDSSSFTRLEVAAIEFFESTSQLSEVFQESTSDSRDTNSRMIRMASGLVTGGEAEGRGGAMDARDGSGTLGEGVEKKGLERGRGGVERRRSMWLLVGGSGGGICGGGGSPSN
jgi:hypothetical protein